MDLFSDIIHTGATFVVVLTALVFVHEWGHYWVARRCGVRVDVFSIGFGPEIFGWTNRAGTRWKISALPLGGYVKFFGDMNAASAGKLTAGLDPAERAYAFHLKPVGQRAAVVAAGPIANFLFAIVLLAGFFATVGQPYTPADVGEVLPGSAAERAGFQVGDRVLAIDGQKIDRFLDMQQLVGMSPGETLTFSIDRQGERVALTAIPDRYESTDPLGNPQIIGRLGLSRAPEGFVRRGPVEALWYATVETGNIVRLTFKFLGQIFEGKRSGEELGGPLRIAKFSSETAKDGIASLVMFMAMLSINLGFVNLLPVPMLDGGHLAFYAWEAAAGRPLSERAQEYGFRIGLALVLSLMVFVTWNDLNYLNIFNFG
ncbi:MAG: RIP metalloprotease RseP [Proteobacteria bacterium]|nr:MAG: RIP metalloprotease RseP [Pseudomonadota bacterium]